MANENIGSQSNAGDPFLVEQKKAIDSRKSKGLALEDKSAEVRSLPGIATGELAADKSVARPNQWRWAPIGVVATILVTVLLARSLGSQGKAPKPTDKHPRVTSPRLALDFGSGQKSKPLSFSASDSKPESGDGLSNETLIPRPTVKGYYEPKVVPYPEGKPVYVNGYYRKDGTYVRAHFRSLPKRR